jgi:hypothetical protein
MMMTQPDRFDLEAALEAARAAPPQMSAALAARIGDDALHYLPRERLWRRILAAVGGPAGLGGLVTATVAGFWLGVAPPAQTVDPLLLFGTADAVAEEDMTDLTGSGWTVFEFASEEG